jgi:hypothetical protein
MLAALLACTTADLPARSTLGGRIRTLPEVDLIVGEQVEVRDLAGTWRSVDPKVASVEQAVVSGHKRGTTQLRRFVRGSVWIQPVHVRTEPEPTRIPHAEAAYPSVTMGLFTENMPRLRLPLVLAPGDGGPKEIDVLIGGAKPTGPTAKSAADLAMARVAPRLGRCVTELGDPRASGEDVQHWSVRVRVRPAGTVEDSAVMLPATAPDPWARCFAEVLTDLRLPAADRPIAEAIYYPFSVAVRPLP